jgi:hypothetical protein
MAIPKNFSIVKLETRHHRKVAQEHWGLTNEQMKGKHVHHRIKRCDGGTNDPSNLYVCSEWYHDNVWHAGEGGFAGCASKGGKLGAKAQPREVRVANGTKQGPENLRKVIERNPDHQRQAAQKAGEAIREKAKTDPEFRQKCVDNGKKTSEIVKEKRKDLNYDEKYRKTRSAGGKATMEKHKEKLAKLTSERCKKPVILANLDTGEEKKFDSLKEAVETLNLNQGNLSAVLAHKRNHTKRWTARFAG